MASWDCYERHRMSLSSIDQGSTLLRLSLHLRDLRLALRTDVRKPDLMLLFLDGWQNLLLTLRRTKVGTGQVLL